MRTFSVYQDFSHFSAYFGLSRYVSSFKWSKIWSKMASDFKFRPADICRSPMSEIFDFLKKFGLKIFPFFNLF
nr:MAG TPA: hypothetical protein [Caudoviricetes sp.]